MRLKLKVQFDVNAGKAEGGGGGGEQLIKIRAANEKNI